MDLDSWERDEKIYLGVQAIGVKSRERWGPERTASSATGIKNRRFDRIGRIERIKRIAPRGVTALFGGPGFFGNCRYAPNAAHQCACADNKKIAAP